ELLELVIGHALALQSGGAGLATGAHGRDLVPLDVLAAIGRRRDLPAAPLHRLRRDPDAEDDSGTRQPGNRHLARRGVAANPLGVGRRRATVEIADEDERV